MDPNRAVRRCKVCGIEYPYCKTWGDPLVFRWQDVACCQEHAAIYLERMHAAQHDEQASAEPVADDDKTAVEQDRPQKRTRKPKSENKVDANK